MMAAPDLILTMPVPPSTNKLWSHPHGQRGRVRSPEYKEWIEKTGWLVRMQLIQFCHRPILGKFRCRIEVPTGRRDINNYDKPLLDLAQHIGAIANDRHMTSYEVVPNAARTDCMLMFWREGPDFAAPKVPRTSFKKRQASKPKPRVTLADVARQIRMLPK